MLFPKVDSYISEVLRKVRFKADHDEIRREFLAHFEDKIEDMAFRLGNVSDAEDLPPELLFSYEEQAIMEMGDAEKIGKVLNKEHNVVLGWLFYVVKAVFIIAAALLLLGVSSTVINLSKPSLEKICISDYNIVRTIEVNQTRNLLDDKDIYFSKFLITDEKAGILLYSYKKRPWEPILRVGASLAFDSDELSAHAGLEQEVERWSRAEGMVYHCPIPETATKVIIDWQRYNHSFTLEIPLEGGSSHE